jgi:tetratricopeptide (TPR) repeat protein
MLQVAAAPVAERYAYLPSIGVALLVGIAVAHAAARAPRVTLGVAALLVVALGAATMQRTLVWQSDEALWSDAAAKAPDEAHPLNELAVLRERRGDLEGALDLWLRARPLTADRQLGGTIDGNIGVIHFRRGEYAKAREYLESGLRLHPDQFNAQRTLGAVLYTQAAALPMAGPRAGDARVLLADSRANYETALRLSPGSIPARLELALVLARLGDLDARAGRVREATGLYREALSYLEWVFARQPATAEVPATRALADALRAAVRKSAR